MINELYYIQTGTSQDSIKGVYRLDSEIGKNGNFSCVLNLHVNDKKNFLFPLSNAVSLNSCHVGILRHIIQVVFYEV
jgi:hypothetical protein